MTRLEGKVAVITGGASGIGRACVEVFRREGATIVVADLDKERGAESAAAVYGTFVATDTSSEESCEALAAAAVERHGRIDVLVAAAGISHALYVSGQPRQAARDQPGGNFLIDKPVDYWRRVLDVNLTGVMMTNRAVAKRMIEAGNGGAIVNIASGAARTAIPGAVDYCVSKAGVWMLTKGLALELAGHNIRVNAVGPGFIETPMTASFRQNDAMVSRLVARTPLRRLGTPEDIAHACLFLVSDEASFVTGEILFPDGGLAAQDR
jgi:NAD(P)-dependent dehydrogenase (short-subunit alcohol dehydrogenase family)